MPAARSAPAGTTPPQSWVWGFGRLAVYAYYRVDRIGGVLPDGALLLVANHPNTLIDPAVIQTTAGRRVRFLAKSTLFAWHPLSPLIRRSGAIPVYRKMDPGVDTSRNVEMFSAVAAALAAGEAICLFPEGTSHAHGRLEPLRTGAARMVLNSGAAGHPVTIVPVGLNFDALARFRSRALAVFGRPVDYADLVASYGNDEAAAVRTLTDRIEQRLKRLMVEAEPRHDLPIVERIDRLYAAARGASRDARERLGRRRLIAAGMARLREQDPARLAELMRLVEEHLASLARFGLRERDPDQRIPAAAGAASTEPGSQLSLRWPAPKPGPRPAWPPASDSWPWPPSARWPSSGKRPSGAPPAPSSRCAGCRCAPAALCADDARRSPTCSTTCAHGSSARRATDGPPRTATP